MARSTYVYVVEGTPDGGYFWSLQAAFTVKHELIRWLRQRDTSLLMVTRLPDGASDLSRRKPTVMDIAELLACEGRITVSDEGAGIYVPCSLRPGHLGRHEP